MSTEQVGEWLQPFGIESFAGQCVLTYSDEIAVSVEITADGLALQLSAALATLPEDATRSFLRSLLAMNHKGQKTGGGALAIGETGSLLVLCLAWPIQALDRQSFANMFGTFLDNAAELRAWIVSRLAEADAREAPGPIGSDNAVPV